MMDYISLLALAITCANALVVLRITNQWKEMK